MANLRAHVLISGRVQGVFYRDHAQRQAVARGLSGWVRNLPDGRVEAMFEGEEQGVRELVAWCRRGSPRSYVTDVEVSYQPFAGEFGGFHVRW